MSGDYETILSKDRVIWMMNCIQEAFELPSNNNLAVDLFQEHAETIYNFHSAESPPKLVVYYQHISVVDDYDHDGSTHDRKLFLTSGEVEKLDGKGVYFMRVGNEDIEPEVVDNKVLFGEINQQTLQQMKIMMGKIFEPFIRNMDDREWGECDQDQRKDFLSTYTKFVDEMSSGLKSLSSSNDSYKIDKEEYERARLNNNEQKFYEDLFSRWLEKMETIIKVEESPCSDEDGPETELIFWRKRLQNLTLLNELNKSSKDFCQVKNAVCNQNKQKGEDTASSLNTRYRQLESDLTEKLNEAKDNVKYLVTLEKFIEPLKTGTPQEIIETLPALMNAIKMIHTIARYYKSSTTMTKLFIKITNQMINNCNNRIYDRKPGQRMSR